MKNNLKNNLVKVFVLLITVTTMVTIGFENVMAANFNVSQTYESTNMDAKKIEGNYNDPKKPDRQKGQIKLEWKNEKKKIHTSRKIENSVGGIA